MAQKLKGKIALVTGGTTGIGRASAKRFVEEGATVVLTGRNTETLEAARAELGDSAEVIQSDASKEEDVKSLFEQVTAKHGKIDVLFLNAGIAKFAPWEQHSVADFDQMFEVNVKGPWLAIKYGIPALNDGASVIATTSIANQSGIPMTSAYGASKAAVAQLVRTAAAELSPRGIRVNSISPGPIETPIFGKTGMPEDQLQQMASGIVASVPLGRMGTPDEIANMALFLASDESSYVQGQEFVVDGGASVG
jgi:NAD(P)-dependent dehydrogenase (short-subunit alcohol dehydrogenase family)